MATAAQERMRALVEAGIALSSELSLDAVLQKLVETASSLTRAKYAALGVLDPTGSRLERFLTTGIDPETHALIGDLPTGRGILGVLIRDASPLRLHDLSEDPRSVGFPPGHPPMRSFLGVPVALRGIAYGNLYLTEKESGDFTEEDEETTTLLASQAAVAIENARLYESATHWSTQLESLNEVAAALVSELELGPLLELVANRLRALIAADSVTIALPYGDGLRIEAAAGPEAERVLGVTIPARSKTMRVLERKRSERIDSVLDDPEIDQETARRLKMRTAVYVPLVLRGEAIGVITAQDKQGADPASPPRTSGSRRCSRSAPPLRWICRAAWRATRCGGSWRRRSRSAAASRASCTTRPVRRSRPSCSGCAWSRRPEGRPRCAPPSPRCASSSARHCRTCASSRSSFAPRRSTTSGSQPPSSD